METPFYSQYTVEFENGKSLADVAKQFELIRNNFMDSKSKLPFHAWDESGQIGWANHVYGTSPTIWSRAVGWYAMALVDVLDYFPKDNPDRKQLILDLVNLANAVSKYQDVSGIWFQVTDSAAKEGNYLEASGSAMIAYALAKGVNNNYLPKQYFQNAQNAFDGIINNLITVDNNGEVHLNQISHSAGLGGDPFRDGSFKYYTSNKKSTDNSIGVGAFILAALELNR